MLQDVGPENVLFLDIETVPGCKSYAELSDILKKHWAKRCHRNWHRDDDNYDYAELYSGNAGLFAEFGRIIVISCGVHYTENGHQLFRTRSYASSNELELLNGFAEMLNKMAQQGKPWRFCGHNVREFDLPYICRRMLVNGIEIPKLLDLRGRKPWEAPVLDTMDLWKFGDYKNFTALELLCEIMGIPTPKDDIDGSQVAGVFWKDNDLQRIARYCEADVVATAQLARKLGGMPLLEPDAIVKA